MAVERESFEPENGGLELIQGGKEQDDLADKGPSDILPEEPKAESPKTPIDKEVDKYIGNFRNEYNGGLSPDDLKKQLIRASFLKVENNKVTRGPKPDSGMVLEAYKRAITARREKIDVEAKKCLGVLEKYKGNRRILEEALLKQNIIRKGKEGRVFAEEGKSLEYQGYLMALEEYKKANENKSTAYIPQKKADILENENYDGNVDSDIAYKHK